MRTSFIAIALLAAASCSAQVRVGSPGPRFGGSSPHRRSSFYPVFMSDNFYSDPFTTGYPLAAQPPVVIVQTPPSAPVTDPPPPVKPLMIELQAGRYMQAGEEDFRVPVEPAPSRVNPSATTSPSESQSVILIFRDGHREEVGSYTIADGMLYSRGDYYNDGSWTKKFDLRSLNLAETIASNQSRGIRFQLPASPNEVIARF